MLKRLIALLLLVSTAACSPYFLVQAGFGKPPKPVAEPTPSPTSTGTVVPLDGIGDVILTPGPPSFDHVAPEPSPTPELVALSGLVDAR